MFGINRKELIKNLETIRKYLCSYNSSSVFCDCKYDHTGCPEIRQVIALLKHITDSEFSELSMKSNIMIQY